MQRRRPDNTAAKAKRHYNQNVRHYRDLHDSERERSPSEIETMKRAAKRRPGGDAAKMLTKLGIEF